MTDFSFSLKEKLGGGPRGFEPRRSRHFFTLRIQHVP